jgi:3-oxoacyl-ACP reductase-like protein
MRAAVVGGGAYLAGRSRGRAREQETQAEYEQNQRISDLEQQQAPAPAQAPAQAPVQAPAGEATSPMLDQLNQLAALHQQGVLTDDEFTAAKAKLFGS